MIFMPLNCLPVLSLDLQHALLQSPGHQGRRRPLLFRVLKAVNEEPQPRIRRPHGHDYGGLELERHGLKMCKEL